MSLNCGASFVKYLLCFFNFLLFVIGGALLAVSIWVAIDNTSFFLLTKLTDHANLEDHNEVSVLETGAYILIAAGALLFILGFLGCCGAVMESKGLLATYGALVILIFLLEITAGILIAVYKQEVEDHLEEFLKGSLRKQYSNPEAPNSMTVTWDAMMVKLECCGVNNYTDFQNSIRWQDNRTIDQVVPRACCIPLKGRKQVQIGVHMEETGTDTISLLDENCIMNPTDNNSYYLTGCHGRLKEWAETNCNLLVGVLSGVGILELLLIVLSFCLCASVGRKSK